MTYKSLKNIQELLARAEELYSSNKITKAQGIKLVNYFEDNTEYFADNGRRYTKSQSLNRYMGFDIDSII